MNRTRKRSLSQAVILGAASGFAGAWAMTLFTRSWNAALDRCEIRSNESLRPPLPYSQQEWESTSAIAQTVAVQVLGRHLSATQEKTGARIVHYAVGVAGGAFFAVVNNQFPSLAKSSGALAGLAMWLVGNRYVIPAIGLSRDPRDYSLLMQANAAGEHLAYAITTNFLQRVL